jgi:hypothetical protein
VSRCRDCGKDAYPNKFVCMDCMDAWKALREAAFNQAVAEIGPLNAKNLKAIQKRVKQLEKEATK